jgi:adenine-specific DNA-methyltransferase
MEKELPVIVGDANGADKAVQQDFFSKGYQKVEAFCSGSVCRNNVGHWNTRNIDTTTHDKGRAFYTLKDRAMALEATCGFMVWDEKSSGTLLNVLRLLRQCKKVVVYLTSEHRFTELRASDQWEGFIAHYGAEFRLEMEQMIDLEERKDRKMNQTTLLPLASN